ncbi:MAG TPA: F0F1 ATP synthase subunit delta [Pseudomonadales bacterium]|nr:F0F1 ATP synthase subunit delta [Pseudomonadales bacterium]
MRHRSGPTRRVVRQAGFGVVSVAEFATLARPYANAAFDVAKSAGRLDEWSRGLNLLALASENPNLKAMIQSPTATTSEKAFKLAELFRDDLLDPVRQFVHVLAENKRLSLLAEITTQFEVRRAEEARTLDVEVTTAVPLSDSEQRRFQEILERRFEQHINLTTTVDKTVIGGAHIRAGDMVIDGSLRGRLAKLGEAFARS